MNLRSLSIAATLCAGLLGSSPVQADQLTDIFSNCSRVRCVIKLNLGGDMEEFNIAAQEIVNRGVPLVMVDGICASACVMAVDALKQRGVDVCITPIAEFYFHKASVYGAANADGLRPFKRYEDVPHSPYMLKWIKAHGDFPKSNSLAKMLKMDAYEASRFWRQCKPQDYR